MGKHSKYLDQSKLAALKGMRISKRAAKELSSCPPADLGCHTWTFTAALALFEGSDFDDEKIGELVRQHMTRDERPHNEVESAVASAKRVFTGELIAKKTPKAKRSNCLITSVARSGWNVAELQANSPCPPVGIQAEEFLEALFPGDPYVCCGFEVEYARTKKLSAFGDLPQHMQYVVPSAMTGPTGLTQSGKESPRCNGNTGQRMYLVTEFDFPVHDPRTTELFRSSGKSTTHDLCAAIIGHLRPFAPLSMVVHSGGKSLHAWWRCRGATDKQLEEFFRKAVTLGADPKTWTPSQFIRMPGGIRRKDDGTTAPQRVLYWDPTKMHR